MTWITFSLLAAICWAIVNVINKFILSKWTFNFTLLLGIFSIVSILASVFVFLFQGFTAMSVTNTLIGLTAGIGYYLTVYFYYKALNIEEVSRVIPLYNLTPIFVAIFATMFLGEVLTITNYAGIVLIVIGAILISNRKLRKVHIGKALWFMILATLALTVVQILTKYLLGFADYWTVFAYTRVGTFLSGVPLLLFKYEDISAHIQKYGNKLVGLVTFSNILNYIGVLFITIATAEQFVTLANALASTQPLFVLAIVVVLSIFYPQILKEEIDKETLTRKVISIVLILGGVFLVT